MPSCHSFALRAAAFLFCGVLPMYTQTFSGSISGLIRDGSGAVIPQAQVVLLNIDTSVTRSTASDSGGLYSFPLVNPGNYRVEVSKTGFKKALRQPIEVQVQSRLTIDLELQVGTVSEVVEVTASTPLLEQNSSSLGQVIENQKIVDLPLNGRNLLSLVSLTAGVVPQGNFGQHPAVGNSAHWGNFSANGGIANSNEVLVDGAPATRAQMNAVGYIPPVDAVQEFKVQTNNHSAEFGRTGGAVVNMSIKSGTNQVHGTLYEFFRNKVLDANNFFANRSGQQRPPFTYNQYGGSIGGPVYIPKLYDGRNRTFFFVNHEWFKQRQGISFLESVPAAVQRDGDFSQTLNSAGGLIRVADPFSTRPDPANPGRFIRDSFPGNRIPSSRFDPVARAFVQLPLWPTANLPGDPRTGINNFATNATYPVDSWSFATRLDHQISSKQRIFGRVGIYNRFNDKIDPFRNNTTLLDEGAINSSRVTNVAVNYDYSFTPTLIGEVRAGFLRFNSGRLPPSHGFDLTTLGFPASLANSVPYKHMPWITVAGLTGIASSSGSRIEHQSDNYTLMASVTKIAGRHTLKVGGEARDLRFNNFQTNNSSGNFGFDARFTSADPLRSTATDGYGFASFLLGVPASGALTNPEPLALTRYYYAAYFQDDFRVSSKLTLNLGLRWDMDTAYTERYGRLSFFDETARYPVAVPNAPPLRGKFGFVETQEEPSRFVHDLQWKMFSPHFGFAYNVTRKTVVRGGYGISWLPFNLNTPNAGTANPPFAITTNFVSSLDGGITPVDRLSNPFPNGILSPPGRTGDFNREILGQGFSYVVRRDRPGYTQQWNFDVQRELPGSWLIDIAYAGSRGTRLPVNLQRNQLTEEQLALGTRLNEQVPNPFFGLVSIGPLSSPTYSRGQSLRPYPQFNAMTINEYSGFSVYHAGTLKVEKRFGQGFSMLGAFTWAKTISNSESQTGWLEAGGTGAGSQNAYNRAGDRSVSSYDIPQRLVVSALYELPFGRGRQLLSSVNPAVDKLLSGWQVNAIYTAQSGTPLFFSTATNLTNSQGGGSRPNSTGVSARLDGDSRARIQRWFDTSQFVPPAAFTFGNLGRTLPDVRGHGVNNIDLSFFKNTRFGNDGRYNVQLRAELFNAANRVQFGKPGTALGNAQFGVVSSQANLPRQIQLALKFVF